MGRGHVRGWTRPHIFEEVHLSLARKYPIKVRKYKKSDAGQPLFHVWRLLDRPKLSFPNKTLFPSERTYHCPATSDLLTAVVYENGHRFTHFQGRMKKLLGTIDADRKTAAPPLDSKLQGPPICGQFWTEGDSVVPE